MRDDEGRTRDARIGRMGSKDRVATSRFISRAALVAKSDLRDAISELRLLAAMVALTLAVPIAGSRYPRPRLLRRGTAVVNRLLWWVHSSSSSSRELLAGPGLEAVRGRERARDLEFFSPHR